MKKFAVALTAAIAILFAGVATAAPVQVKSPDGKVTAKVMTTDDGRLSYHVMRGGTAIIEQSPMGITVGGTDLGAGVKLGNPERDSIDETYDWRGVKDKARNHCTVTTIPVTHTGSDTSYHVVFRAYNDGVAYRYVVPGSGTRKVTGEASAWRLPAGSEMWYQTDRGNYEGIYQHAEAASKAGTKLGFPATIILPDGTYAAITESQVFNYSGMTAEVAKSGDSAVLKGIFEDDPKGWQLQGTIKSPWRITMTGPDLNALVNCDIVHNVCPAPDKELYPRGINTEWLEVGRATWNWWSGSPVDFKDQKWWVDQAQKLGFEYHLVDAGWNEKWNTPERSKWDRMRELCNYGEKRGVGIWVWRNWKFLKTHEAREDFFGMCQDVGVEGVKIDYMDNESTDVIDFYVNSCKDAAKHKIMVNFHGANKPTGEARTFPNEVTREGIRGLEYNKWSKLPRHHYAALPFTRFLAGHGDFTACTFDPDKIKGTTFTLQLATAIAYTSPQKHWADRPERYYDSPALPVIKAIPSVWDETVVLPGSKIGDVAALARRSGDEWFVAVINGGEKKQYDFDLSFLGDGEYKTFIVRDDLQDPTKMKTREMNFSAQDSLSAPMRAGGGYVAWFRSAD